MDVWFDGDLGDFDAYSQHFGHSKEDWPDPSFWLKFSRLDDSEKFYQAYQDEDAFLREQLNSPIVPLKFTAKNLSPGLMNRVSLDLVYNQN